MDTYPRTPFLDHSPTFHPPLRSGSRDQDSNTTGKMAFEPMLVRGYSHEVATDKRIQYRCLDAEVRDSLAVPQKVVF
jgi:hypothetical protein